MAFSFSKIPLLTYLTFVTLFATHYGLTFCLFMGTLYDTTLRPTLFLQTFTITQPDLMPKSLNELLHHWRSGLLMHCSKKQPEQQQPTDELSNRRPDVVYAHIVPSRKTDLGNNHASPSDHEMNESVVYSELQSMNSDDHPAKTSADLHAQVRKP